MAAGPEEPLEGPAGPDRSGGAETGSSKADRARPDTSEADAEPGSLEADRARPNADEADAEPERWGPLLVRRLHKADGRSLFLYRWEPVGPTGEAPSDG